MKHYSKEFKEEALKLSDEIGVKKASQQLGIAYYTLADWRSIRRNTPPAKTPSAEEQTIRIRELERENAELRTANNILKDALVFSRKTARSKSVRATPVRSRTQGCLHGKGYVPRPAPERVRLLPVAGKQGKAEQASTSCGQDQCNSCGASG